MKIEKKVDFNKEKKVNYTFYVSKEVSEQIEELYKDYSFLKRYTFFEILIKSGLKHFKDDIEGDNKWKNLQ